MSSQKTPKAWLDYSYLSLKPLASYIDDLAARLHFVGKWIESNDFVIFWLPGLFCIPCFFTGVVQTFARTRGHAIDGVEMDFKIPTTEPTQPADVGVFVQGLYLEGCCWDSERQELDEPSSQPLLSKCPTIWLMPCIALQEKHKNSFDCPVYMVSSRCEIWARKSYQ